MPSLDNMTHDTYPLEWAAAIKAAKTDEEVYTIIDRIYTDGFQDGTDNAEALYRCKDDNCDGLESRSAATIQEAGDPYCPVCGGDMIAA